MLTVREWSIPIDLLGIPAEFHQTKPPAKVINLPRIGIATVAGEDNQLITTLGVGAKALTIKASDMGSTVPAKFDVVRIHGKNNTIETVLEVFEPGTGALCGWKCYTQGVK